MIIKQLNSSKLIIKLMTELNRRNSNHNQLTNKKRTKLDTNNDVFQQFQNSRKTFKDKQKLQTNNMIFKTKTKPNENDDQENYYDDEFEQFDNIHQNKSKRHSQKKINNINQSPKIDQESRTRQLKLTQKNRSVKSAMDYENDGPNSQPGRYLSQVDKKFGNINGQTTTNQAINRANEQIKQYIKKYNDTLTDIINKNLAQLGNKKKKPITVEQLIKVTQQQIRNNQKIQQLDQAELKKLQGYKNRLQEQQNYSERTIQQEIFDLQSRIKQKKKQIHTLKLSVQNEAKKLLPAGVNLAKSQNQSEMTILKDKLANMRKQFDKLNDKMGNLQSRQYELTTKIQGFGGVDRQAFQIKSNQKQIQDKKKKYLQTKKKYDDIKSHVSKTDALWNTKCSVSAHQNQGIKQKIKNIDLQIKNMEQSIKQAYEKSMKILTSSKPKNQSNIKILQKMKMQMDENSEYKQKSLNVKQMSLSQMKILTKKKQSSDNLSLNAVQNPLQKQQKPGQLQTKTKSQQSQRNRVWKQENAKLQQEKLKKLEQTNNRQQKQFQKAKVGQSKTLNLKPNTKQGQISDKKQQEEVKEENRPKKFNFGRNKATSEMKLAPSNQQINKSTNQNIKNEFTRKIEENKRNSIANNEQLKQNNQKQQKPNQQEQIIKPKRFNMLRDRKSRQQNTGYTPSIQTNQNNEQKQIEKPMINLKRKKEGDNKQKLIHQNQFMGE